MLLRHTKHNNINGDMTCSTLFDPPGDLTKRGWVYQPTPAQQGPLFALEKDLRKQIRRQNPPNDDDDEDAEPAVHLTHQKILESFGKQLSSGAWPENDAALDFKIPSLDPRKNEAKKASVLKSVLTRGGKGDSLKREREEDGASVASTSSKSSTAVSSGTVPRKIKRVKKSEDEN
ncbi:hypothetical protein B0H19DRAFT_1105741 [Mycena capillaripes]|nr:hypothetical protein B0H19DRAFT_1105741 [Mycena capillaripes]